MRQIRRYSTTGTTTTWALLILFTAMTSQAQEALPLPAAKSSQVPEDPINKEVTLMAIQSRLKIAEENAAIVPDKANTAMVKRQAQWQRVTELLEMQITRIKSEQQELTSDPIVLPPDSPPFSINYLDHVRQKYRSFNDSYKLIKKEIKAVQHRIEVNKTTLNDTSHALHEIEEKGATAEKKLNIEVTFQVAKEAYIASRLDARLTNNKLKLARQNIDRWSKWLPKVESQVAFSIDDYNSYLKKIKDREKELKNALIFIQQAIKREHNKTMQQQVYVKRLKALRDLLNESIAYLPKEQTIWEERRELYHNKVDAKKVIDRRQQALLEQEALNKLVRVKELRSEEQKGITSPHILPSEKAHKKEISLEKTILFNQELAFKSLRSLSHLLNTYLADLETIQSTRQLFYFKEKAANIFNALWLFEIAIVQDQMITVRKVVMAIVFFAVAVYLTRLILLKLLFKLLLKMHISEGASFMVSHLLYYLLLFIFLFVAISTAGIPLAVFALFGGALAIAAGFGSQKILNNFLSGLILLVERSIQVGDMIEVDKTQGRVKRIGLRNVHIKTFSNADILVPNSKFLEENVINWTLESNIIKSNISVKVNFDVNFNQVISLLIKTAVDHPKILSEQRPTAFLEEFNSDNGYLLFKLYYWLRVPKPEEKLSIESDLRIGILSCLSEHGIALASPTLGVVLNTDQLAT